MPKPPIPRTACPTALALLLFLSPTSALANSAAGAGVVLADGALDGAIRGAAIGAVIGGLVGGIAWLLKKNKKQ